MARCDGVAGRAVGIGRDDALGRGRGSVNAQRLRRIFVTSTRTSGRCPARATRWLAAAYSIHFVAGPLARIGQVAGSGRVVHGLKTLRSDQS